MPTLADYQHDPDREAAYRRGYTHGIANMMSGVVDRLSDAEKAKFEVWFGSVLTPWSRGDATKLVLPPDFPRLDH